MSDVGMFLLLSTSLSYLSRIVLNKTWQVLLLFIIAITLFASVNIIPDLFLTPKNGFILFLGIAYVWLNDAWRCKERLNLFLFFLLPALVMTAATNEYLEFILLCTGQIIVIGLTSSSEKTTSRMLWALLTSVCGLMSGGLFFMATQTTNLAIFGIQNEVFYLLFFINFVAFGLISLCSIRPWFIEAEHDQLGLFMIFPILWWRFLELGQSFWYELSPSMAEMMWSYLNMTVLVVLVYLGLKIIFAKTNQAVMSSLFVFVVIKSLLLCLYDQTYLDQDDLFFMTTSICVSYFLLNEKSPLYQDQSPLMQLIRLVAHFNLVGVPILAGGVAHLGLIWGMGNEVPQSQYLTTMVVITIISMAYSFKSLNISFTRQDWSLGQMKAVAALSYVIISSYWIM